MRFVLLYLFYTKRFQWDIGIFFTAAPEKRIYCSIMQMKAIIIHHRVIIIVVVMTSNQAPGKPDGLVVKLTGGVMPKPTHKGWVVGPKLIL